MNLPKSPRQIAIAIALCGLIALLVPVWIVHLLIWRVRTARRTASPVDIPRVDAAGLDLDSVMNARRPVIITGLVDDLELDLVPDVDGLRTLAATGDRSPFSVKTHRDHSPYFLYRGDYGAELERTQQMELGEFVDFMFDADQVDGTCTYRLFSHRDLDGGVRAIVDDIAAQLSTRARPTPDPLASGLWIGSKGVVTPLHHDAWTGLLFQFHGTKRIRMFAPGDRVNLYFSSPWSPKSVWSRLPGRSSDTDIDEFPRFAHATPHEAHLEAGEALFIPPYWSHEIEALEANISMPFRFKATAREFLDPGFIVPAMEIFDSKFIAPRTLQK